MLGQENREIYHQSVLLEEIMAVMSPLPGELVIDSTTGEGGHSEAFLERFPDCSLICLDADASIQVKAKARLAAFAGRVDFVLGWFDDFFVRYLESKRPDVILFDLGISSFHYQESGRGFSFRREEPLDMRLDAADSKSAEFFVNTFSEKDLESLLRVYGEEFFSRRIAQAVTRFREVRRIQSAKEFADIVWKAVPVSARFRRLHPATKSFQALRIVVNRELERLDRALKAAFGVLNRGGRLGVVSFHSLEDRLVKSFFRFLCQDCVCQPNRPVCDCGGRPLAKSLTRKPLCPGDAEKCANSASRSARLRVIQKLRHSRSEE